jgi:type II secretory pathway component PulJ
MLHLILTKKGISLIEVLISLFLISFGILALLSLQPSAWRLSGRSDFLGRGAELLHKEMETTEVWIMNPNNADPCATSNPFSNTTTIFPSGQTAAQSGDIPYAVQRTVQRNTNGTWLVQIIVTWPGNANGIRESRIVTRQENFRWPSS